MTCRNHNALANGILFIRNFTKYWVKVKTTQKPEQVNQKQNNFIASNLYVKGSEVMYPIGKSEAIQFYCLQFMCRRLK